MLKEERGILWRTAAVCIGLSLPMVMLGNSIMYALFGIGIITGLLATKDMSLRNTVYMILESKLILLGIGMLVAFTLSAYLGINPDYSLHKVAQVAGLCVGALALVMTLREMPGKYTAMMVLSLVLGIVFMVTLAYVDAFAQSHRISTALHGASMSLQVHRLNFYSSALVVLMPFVWAYYIRRTTEGAPLPKMTAPLVLPFSLAAILLAGGRAGWVALIPTLILFLILAGQVHRVNFHAKHWLALIASLGGGILAYVGTRPKGALMERLEINVGERGLGGGRWDIWNTAIEHLTDQPWTGIGPNAFRFLPEEIDLHPHNFALQLALEVGIIGSVFVAGILLLLFVQFIQYARGNIYGLAVLCSFVAFWTAALFNKSIFDVEWISMFVILSCIGWRVGWSSGSVAKGEVLNEASFINPFKKMK